MKQAPLSRRTILKGLAGTGVGLPFLEEMAVRSARAGENRASVPPVRAFNVFFGLGIPLAMQQEGFSGVLEPLAPLRDQLLLVRGIDQKRCDESGINAHYDGSSAAFTAEPPQGEARAGGGSLDQLIRHGHYPQGLPSGTVPTLVGGTFFRRSRVSRYVHSYNPDGTVAGVMQERPRDLFDRVFGSLATAGDDDARQRRLRQSVLDAVVDQYQFYTGPRSPLGAQSKARVADHLDRIREYEQRALQLPDRPSVENATAPPRSQVPHGGPADPGGMGIDITLKELTTEWRLMADLYALAIQVDRVRFGAITFLAAGERIRLTGDYQFKGEKRFHFDDGRQLNASGDMGCSHEWWHKYKPAAKNEALRAHAHMTMREVAYFLKRLAGDDAREANGKTILENSLITMSTESGDGRHDDPMRELTGVFHAITSAGGRFKTGQFLDVEAEGLDLYNTMLTAMDVEGRLGPQDRPLQRVDAIRA